MTSPRLSLNAIVLAAIVMCIVMSMVGARSEQAKTTTGLKIARVDVSAVMSQYKFAVTGTAAIQKKYDVEVATLRAWGQNNLLAAGDQDALAQLVAADQSAAGASADQKAQEQRLLTKSKGLINEYTALQSKQAGNLTQQDKDRMTELMRRASDTETRVNQSKTNDEDELQTELNTLRTKAVQDVTDAISKVAKDKGYNLVLSSEVAYYTDTDLTDTVVASLNK
ncbi:MAG: OmpH family outer membrane protein [Armatimonadetes bacterium]|nr:OmpH family outer membrane protein [Armatimonadota bacterium]MDE2207282.1 OmpH family outer membrane protein [Armatimonadota bacterium]